MSLYVQYLTGGFDTSSPLNVFGSMTGSNQADMAASFAQFLASVNLYCSWQVRNGGEDHHHPTILPWIIKLTGGWSKLLWGLAVFGIRDQCLWCQLQLP